VSDQSTHVDVIHVTTVNNDGPTSGVVQSNNLLAGSSGKVIFGFNFKSNYSIPTDPKINSFRISFNQPVGTVFSSAPGSYKIVEAPSGGNYTTSLIDVATTGASVTLNGATTELIVDFGGSPRNLTTNPNLGYFLVVN